MPSSVASPTEGTEPEQRRCWLRVQGQCSFVARCLAKGMLRPGSFHQLKAASSTCHSSEEDLVTGEALEIQADSAGIRSHPLVFLCNACCERGGWDVFTS